MTPRLLIWQDGEIIELSIESEKQLDFAKLDLVQTRISFFFTHLAQEKCAKKGHDLF